MPLLPRLTRRRIDLSLRSLPTQAMRNALKPWWPVLLWMGLIFVVSTDLGSFQHTSRFIGPFLRWLNPDISPEAVQQVQFLVRKAAHFTEYGILALLTLRAVRQSRPHQHNLKAAGLALLISAAYATSDEFHQSLVPSRTASAEDVLIDTAGAVTALALAVSLRKLRGPATPPPNH